MAPSSTNSPPDTPQTSLDDPFEVALSKALRRITSPAEDHLKAGNPIYYADPDTPDGLVIKHYPDGHRELVRWDGNSVVVVAVLDARS